MFRLSYTSAMIMSDYVNTYESCPFWAVAALSTRRQPPKGKLKELEIIEYEK